MCLHRGITSFTDGLNCALWWTPCRADGTRLCPAWGQTWPPPTEATPAVAPATTVLPPALKNTCIMKKALKIFDFSLCYNWKIL